MKRISVIVLISILMAISFVGIGLLILYGSGTVTSVDDAKRLLSEEPPRVQANIADGVDLLEKQQTDIAEELARTKRTVEALKTLSDSLTDAANSISNSDPAVTGLARVSGILAGMDNRTAATTLAALDPDLAIRLLERMTNQRASAILNEIEDDPTRTKLFKAMAGK